ncbi:MAG: DUF935 domain-containing protein [Oxalobacter sp.]|nr:MAG: DUF935 domain-containing protein [Oxalobacter sp.]
MAQILDHNGNPIERKALSEPQTARLGWLHREFENHPSLGITPRRLAGILEAAEQGNIVAQHEFFNDMEEKDAHIFAEISKRKRVIETIDWAIVAPRNPSKSEEDDCAWLQERFADMRDLNDTMYDLLDAIGHGFSALEIEWAKYGKEWLPKALHHRPQSWFVLPQASRNELRLRTMAIDGEPLTPGGWLIHIHKAKSGYLARSGLHRILSWPFIFKNYAVRDLAEFLEIYGLPLRLGKYPSGSNDIEKAELLRAVVGIGHNAGGIIAQGMDIEFEEAAKGQSDPYMAMLDWAERSASKAILGQTTSSEAKSTGMGSGVANLHGDVRDDLKKSDARQLAGTLSQLAWLMLVNNRGPRDPHRVPRFEFDTSDPEDITVYSEALPKLVGVGMQIPSAWAHKKLQIPQPADGEDVLQTLSVASSFAPSDLSRDTAMNSVAVNVAAQGSDAAAPDAIDDLSDEMASEWEETMLPMVAPLEELAANCATLDEFRDRLGDAVKNMDTAKLEKILALGTFNAQILGRATPPKE